MNIKVEKPTSIENGIHTGVIIDVNYRQTPFAYTDLVIEFDEGMQLKAGYPTKVMEQSKLGLLLKRFGIVVAEGLQVDPDILKGKACSFMTIQKASERGVFANVIPDSVQPISEKMIHEEAVNKLTDPNAK